MLDLIYIILFGYDYEGEEVEGVFSTREAAFSFAGQQESYGDELILQTWSLDGDFIESEVIESRKKRSS